MIHQLYDVSSYVYAVVQEALSECDLHSVLVALFDYSRGCSEYSKCVLPLSCLLRLTRLEKSGKQFGPLFICNGRGISASASISILEDEHTIFVVLSGDFCHRIANPVSEIGGVFIIQASKEFLPNGYSLSILKGKEQLSWHVVSW